MQPHDTDFADDVADAYARWLVPMLFEPYADDMATRIAATAPREVLETAAGTGVLTRRLAATLPHAHIVATDLSASMLDVARRSMPAAHVDWRVADAQSLPFDEARFDVVACQFGVMFYPDRLLGYREARRILRDGGRFVFSLWDALPANALADAVTAALAARYPFDPPDFLPRVPYACHEPEPVRRELGAAGFASVRIEPVELRSRATDARQVAIAFCTGTPLRHAIESREPGGLAAVVDAVTASIASRFGDGAIDVPMRALVIEARR